MEAKEMNKTILAAIISTSLHISAEYEPLTHKEITDRAVSLRKVLAPLYPVTDGEWEEVLREIAGYADCLVVEAVSKRKAGSGRMFIDVDTKIAATESQEEKDAWEAQREMLESGRIDFCEGWHVGIYRQACGHWEVLQHPIYKNYDGTPMFVDGQPYTAECADTALRKDSAERKCTRCICGR